MRLTVCSLLLTGCLAGDVTGLDLGQDGPPDPDGGGVDPVDAAGDPGRPDAGPDAGPGPADAAPGAVDCATPGLLFCEDFEASAPGPASSETWIPETQNGSLTIDGVHARGAQALHVHTEGNGRAYIRVPGFTPPDNSFHVRAWIYVEAFPTAPNFAHFTLIEAAGEGAGLIRPVGGQYVEQFSASLWGVGSDGGPTGDWTDWQPTTPAEAGRWICMEVALSDEDSRIDVSIDGVPRPELSVSKTEHGGAGVDLVFPSFTSIWFGWQLYQGGPTPAAFDLWFDDLVLSTSPPGC